MSGSYLMVHQPSNGGFPPGQTMIQTNNVTLSHVVLDLAMQSRKCYPVMSVVTGPPGTGKSVMLDGYLSRQKPLPGTGMVGVIKNEVKPRPIEKGLAMDLAISLQDKITGRTTYAIEDEIVDAIQRNFVQLLIFDEADRLNEACFELIRHIFDRTGCPAVLVGLPSIWRVINQHDKFKSRIGLKMQFQPILKEEMLHTILPQLYFEHWLYDPKNEVDLQLGEYIWSLVGSSLRKLRNLLQNANSVVVNSPQYKQIDKTVIQEAKAITPLDDKSWIDEDDEGSTNDGKPGHYEEESERRNNGKKRRNRRPRKK